jgi:hypothetical protein
LPEERDGGESERRACRASAGSTLAGAALFKRGRCVDPSGSARAAVAGAQVPKGEGVNISRRAFGLALHVGLLRNPPAEAYRGAVTRTRPWLTLIGAVRGTRLWRKPGARFLNSAPLADVRARRAIAHCVESVAASTFRLLTDCALRRKHCRKHVQIVNRLRAVRQTAFSLLTSNARAGTKR